ncbi:MAG: family 31 glucosidase, partial [Eubacteriales bacterium]|nr:family 31 glucosidase [Eubacteriales bacterium]
MIFESRDGKLLAQQGKEHLCIEPWGTDSLRVRATKQAEFITQRWALVDDPEACTGVEITVGEEGASICNGKLKACVGKHGQLSFYKDGALVLQEFDRFWENPSPQGFAMVKMARTYTPIIGGDFAITQRFEARADEKIYGMGQYQQPNFNLKGCILEMAQRNTQVCVPFALSSLGYGLLWNNPAVGEAVFGNNYTQFTTHSSKQIEYWITAGDTP